MRSFIGSLVLLISLSSQSQIAEFKLLCEIDTAVTEVSGIIGFNNGRFAVIGDSGNEPSIFVINTEGEIVSKTYLQGIDNVDWEELQSGAGHYIGDFGNNLNNREDLRFIRPGFQYLNYDTMSTFYVDYFTYPDQTNIPEPNPNLNFDCEAFIPIGSKKHLFTKNHGESGYTKRYEFDNLIGDQELILLDSTYTGVWITGAYYDEYDDRLWLLSDKHVMRYDSYSIEGMSNKVFELELPTEQLEGIFVNEDEEIFLVEDVEGISQKSRLYRLLINDPEDLAVTIGPNPSWNVYWVRSNHAFYQIEVFKESGQLILNKEFPDGRKEYEIDANNWNPGIYIVKTTTKSASKTQRVFREKK